MNFSQRMEQLEHDYDNQSNSDRPCLEKPDTDEFDSSTIECYRRRSHILPNTRHTEWWIPIAVLLVTAGFGLAVL